MADVTTNLRIKGDDREMRKMGQTVRQAFSPTALREFRRATQDLEGQLVKLTRRQTDLNRQMEGVKRGSAEFRKFRDEVRQADDQVKLIMGSLKQLDRVQERAARQQRYGPGRNFVAGLGQGLGVAQYIPTEPGMGYRIGGAMAGRAMSTMAAPFMQPGIGGIAALAQGVTGVGTALAGGLQTAAGAYQTAVGFQRQRREGLFQGTDVWGRGSARPFTAQESAQIAKAEQDLRAARAVRGVIPLTPAQEEREKAYQDLADTGAATKTTVPEELKDLVAKTPAQSAFARRLNEAAASYAAAEAKVVAEEDAALRPPMKGEGPMARGKPAHGAVNLQEASKAKADADIRKVEQRLAEARAPRFTAGMAAQLGLTPQEALQLQVQFMQARGGLFQRGAPVEGQMGEAAVGTAFGVNAGLSGMFARGAMPGGGGRGTLSQSQVIGAALATGLDGSQISEYLETLVGLQQKAEQSGQKIDEDSFARLTFRLGGPAEKGGLGFEGLQARRVAEGLATKPMRLAQEGPQSGADMMLLREAGRMVGVDPAAGPAAYFKSMRALEELGPEVGASAVRRQIQSARGQDESTQQGNLVRVMRNVFRTEISFAQAEKMIKAETAGGDQLDMLVDQTLTESRKRAAGLPDLARQRVGEVAPALGGEARLAQQTITIGKSVTTSMQAFATSANTMSEQVARLNGVMTSIAEAVTSLIKFLAPGAKNKTLPKG